jgi:hypothetical protein
LVYVRGPDSSDHAFLEKKSLLSGEIVELYQFERLMPKFPKISPDGKSILFQIARDNGSSSQGWAVMPIAGGTPTNLKMPVLASQVRAFNWAPDGKAILYAKNENGVGNIWSASLDGGHSRKLTNFNADKIFSFDVSDNHLIVARGRTLSDLVLLENVK